jgi:hypothetical protein
MRDADARRRLLGGDMSRTEGARAIVSSIHSGRGVRVGLDEVAARVVDASERCAARKRRCSVAEDE